MRRCTRLKAKHITTEDALVCKISDLLHVSRGRVMRLKHDAQQGV